MVAADEIHQPESQHIHMRQLRDLENFVQRAMRLDQHMNRQRRAAPRRASAQRLEL